MLRQVTRVTWGNLFWQRCFCTPRPQSQLQPNEFESPEVLPVPTAFAEIEQFLFFTDLHVNRRNIDTCHQVLQTVWQTARELNEEGTPTGIAFLGDFWHSSTQLPVDTLNTVLDLLSTYAAATNPIPVIMIPGNHDQVTLGGQTHALTPLMHAINDPSRSDQATCIVISRPSVFLGGLWIPYLYNKYEFQNAIKSTFTNEVSSPKGIFCHASIAGATYNATGKVSDAIPVSCFPSGVPVYSGHFHKPQTLEKITYIGSPFQVTLNEAEQQKQMLLLSRNDWQLIRSIPLDVGPRFFNVKYEHGKFDSLVVDGPTVKVRDQVLREGDCVVLRIKEKIDHLKAADAAEIVQLKDKLKPLGLRVDVRSAPGKIADDTQTDLSIMNEAARTPKNTLEEYMNETMSEEAKDFARKCLQEVENDFTSNIDIRPVHLQFKYIKISGFGCFKDPVEYNFLSRGLVLVTGTKSRKTDNVSSQGAGGSNGAGKTTLMMASLWALTGMMDERPSSGSKPLTSEVVHDKCKEATVTLTLDLNGTEMVVTRTARRSRKLRVAEQSNLRILYGSEDLSKDNPQDTQGALEEMMNLSLLPRVVFFGQHSIGGLANLEPKALREELGYITPVNIWIEALGHAKEQLKECKTKVVEFEAVCHSIQQELHQHRDREENLKNQMSSLREQSNSKESAIEKRDSFKKEKERLDSVLSSLLEAERSVLDKQNELQIELQDAESDLEKWNQAWVTAKKSKEVQANYDELIKARATSMQELVDVELSRNAARRAYKEASDYEKEMKQIIKSSNTSKLPASLQKSLSALDAVLHKVTEQKSQVVALDKEHKEAQYPLETSKLPSNDDMTCETCLQSVDVKTFKILRDELMCKAEAVCKKLDEAKKVLITHQDVMQKYEKSVEEGKAAFMKQVAENKKQTQQKLVSMEGKLAAIQLKLDETNQDLAHFNDFGASWAGLMLSQEGLTMKEKTNPIDAWENISAQYKQQVANDVNRIQSGFKKVSQELATIQDRYKENLSKGQEIDDQLDMLEMNAQNQHKYSNLEEQLVRVREDISRQETDLTQHRSELTDAFSQVPIWSDVVEILGPNGIQAHVMEQGIKDLERRAAVYLEKLSKGTISLGLEGRNKATVASHSAIQKTVYIHHRNGTVVARNFKELSGGEQRRLNLALALGYSDLCASRAGFSASMIVLDEGMHHLDWEGREMLAQVLRSLPRDSVFLVSQETDVEGLAFGGTDIVVRDGASSQLIMNAVRGQDY